MKLLFGDCPFVCFFKICCCFLFLFSNTRMLTWNMMTVYFEILRHGVIDAVESALNSAVNYMSECPH